MDPSTPTLTEEQAQGILAGLIGTFVVVGLIVWVLSIIVFWKVFTKAGQPGWASIIPFYNMYVGLKIAGRPGWWIILMLIPFVNIVISVIWAIDMAKSFGKDTVFGVVGLWLFSLIGFAILGFGDAQYRGPAALAPKAAY